MRFKTPLVGITAAGLMLALAACGSTGGPAEDTQIDNENAGAAGSGRDPGAKGPVEIKGAEEGGSINVISSTELQTMDPRNAYYASTIAIHGAFLSRTLTQYKYDEEADSMVLVPDLAEDLGTPNEDYTEWTFKLREGVKDENGTEVTAASIERTVEASMDVDTYGDFPGNYLVDFLVGGDQLKDGKAEPQGVDIDGVEATDDHTLVFKTTKPFADLPAYAYFPIFAPTPEGADPATYEDQIVSTGPYKVKEYVRSKKLVLERNPNWDPKTDPARTAYPDEYVFDFMLDTNKVDARMLADKGSDQTTMTMDDINAANYPKFKSEAEDRIVTGSSPLTAYLAPDYTKVTDIQVRKAIGLAFPYQEFYRTAGYIEGLTANPANTIMPPGTPGYQTYDNPLGVEAGTTDPEAAKKLLEEAGAVGYELKFAWSKDDPDGIWPKLKDLYTDAFTKAGFKVTSVNVPDAKFSDFQRDPEADINVRSYHSMGWFSDWPSGGSWFPPLLTTVDWKATGSYGSNRAKFSEEAVDKKVEEILAMPIEDQPKAWGELDQHIMETYYPWVVTYQGGSVQSHGSKIGGHKIDNTMGGPTYKQLHVLQ